MKINFLNYKKTKILTLLAILVLTILTLPLVSKAELNGGIYTFSQSEWKSNGSYQYVLEIEGIVVKLTCSTNINIDNKSVFCTNGGSLNIESNVPISGIIANSELGTESSNDDRVAVFKTFSSRNNAAFQSVDNKFLIKIIKYGDVYPSIQSIRFSFAGPNGVSAGLIGTSAILRTAYINVLKGTEFFKGGIAKSHRGHMNRFVAALTEGINLLNPVNKDKIALVHWRVTENARLVAVFGTVLDELLTDYDDVERLKVPIASIRSLVGQIRSSYGWEIGLAGNISKASTSLLDVVKLEVQEIMSIKLAIGGSAQIYIKMLSQVRDLMAKVAASRSGDMRAVNEIDNLVALWNGSEWQNELNSILNAGPDFKNLVVPKVVMLLYAIESINDLAGVSMQIPDRKSIK